MIYILIFVLKTSGPLAASTVEFNTLAACQAAAFEMRRQITAANTTLAAPVVLCAAKG